MKKRCVLFILCMMFLVGCSEQNEEIRNSVIEESTETESSLIIEEETEENNVQIEPVAPTKEEVFAMREKVLDGMTDDEKERLTENIKVANLQMERGCQIGYTCIVYTLHHGECSCLLHLQMARWG